ncbi:hypothetical protein [Alteromonas oceanisediminis]|uniref:hypothetical protein n=1 Tax=Alteromonas oceanisediminis TaxID=2836180 RepID=UPI001BDA86C3|nr:hypothetical protein [Alteromonas oceanisediminis]MBT0585220.1 hypothetical protein [Alteromonas oceanisediminis]
MSTKLPKELAGLLKKHPNLVHTEACTVSSHVQRQEDDWYINTIMIKGYDVPFIYKRRKPYASLKGAVVNVTYYPTTQMVADIPFETMKIVRLKRA